MSQILILALSVASVWMCVQDWRRGIFGLLAFLPYVGLPTILLYPAPPETRVLKDLIFVIPAYVGFAGWRLTTHSPRALPKVVVVGGAGLVVLATLHLGETVFSEPMVAAIGLKTWIFYLPLLGLGYHLVRTEEELHRLARWILIWGSLPIAIGLIQSVLVASGNSQLAYQAYGQAGQDVTHGFFRTEVGTGEIAVVASTFTFVSQYYNFVLALLCIAYGHWRSLPKRSARRLWLGLMPLAVIALAGMLSGARGSFVMIPLLLLLALALDADWSGMAQVGLLLASVLAAALTLFRTRLTDLYDLVQGLAIEYLTVSQVNELYSALSTTLWGLGTGTNTGPARLATPDVTTVMLENYYAKTIMELGLPGLAVIVLLFACLLALGFKSAKYVTSRAANAYASPLLAFLAVAIINGWKGSYFDLDPLNVYFWLYAGVLLSLPHVSAKQRVQQSRALSRPVRPAHLLWNQPRTT